MLSEGETCLLLCHGAPRGLEGEGRPLREGGVCVCVLSELHVCGSDEQDLVDAREKVGRCCR